MQENDKGKCWNFLKNIVNKNNHLTHSKRKWSQFSGKNFRMLLKSKKAIHSQSRRGNPYDNALMESFYRRSKQDKRSDRKWYSSSFSSDKKIEKQKNYYWEYTYNL